LCARIGVENANLVRLAHYPPNEHMARVADELGLMVWEKIPVCWIIGQCSTIS
jgi:beta-glucuronidase